MNLQENLKKIRYLIEALVVKFGLFFFMLFSARKASNLASAVSRFIGKKISVSKLAYDNLSKAMPDLSSEQKDKIIDEMWDNLGRVIGEFPHVCSMSSEELMKHVIVDDSIKDSISKLKETKMGGIIFSAHYGNWEIGPKVLINFGLKINAFYRPLNNPYVENMTSSLRSATMIEKGSNGSRKIIEALKNGEFILIMADQRIKDGESVKFFHEDAFTTTAIARLAVKYKIPLIPACIIRLEKDFKFLAHLEEPLEFVETNDSVSDILNLTLKMNQRIESWIRDHPEQWFWVHNRWKK